MNRLDKLFMTGYTQCGWCGWKHNSWRRRAKCMHMALKRYYG